MKAPLPPTAEIAADGSPAEVERPAPGVVVVFAGGKPACVPLPLAGGVVELGRERVDDDAVSRAHASVAFDGRRWTVKDLASRNGTFVDGARAGEQVCTHAPVVRLGRAILLCEGDVRAFAIEGGELTIGPHLRAAYAEIERAATFGTTIHLAGESGSGKELAARRFHAAGPRAAGPFVAVNCAAIPEGVAERLLFGAVRGAYSGADANADGWIQTADRGTLFLDEIAELDLAVQAKLLRVLESREVTALGAARPRPVDFGLCSATHADLRSAAADGSFREDLYFRLGRPAVRLPPLRERREEVPWHVARAAGDVPVEAALVEACLLRHWPGNVRELVSEVRLAAQRAVTASRKSVGGADLAADAGRAMTREAPKTHDRVAIEAALRESGGNVTAAARALGMHRNQLRRWVEKEGGDPT